jgi:hypothetical protein
MSRALHVPTLGEVLTLAAPWTLTLHQEARNKTLFKALGVRPLDKAGRPHPDPNQAEAWAPYHAGYVDHRWVRRHHEHRVTLPAGTKLTVRRLYIRQGAEDYNSVTFSVPSDSPKGPGRPRGRFWAKVADVNTMVVE